MKTLAIAAQKGGCGKSTTAITISSYLARKGHRTLLIDLDGQCNSTWVMFPNYANAKEVLKKRDTIAAIVDERDDLELQTYSSKVENLSIIPSHPDLSQANVVLSSLVDRERRLRYALEPMRGRYEYVIIDCPPDISFLPINALVAADFVITPFNADRFDIQGVRALLEKIQTVQKRLNPDLRFLGFLNTMRDQTNITKYIYESMVKQFGDLVFKTQIPRAVAFREANSSLEDIFTSNSETPAAKAYVAFIEKELLPVISK